MTDPITRARKEWCETPRYPDTRMANICPPEVVAALLVVLTDVYQGVDPFSGRATSGHEALAAITRALEGKA